MIDELTSECLRQEESCLFTSTSLYIWLRQARWIRRVFFGAPIILGALATWSILDRPEIAWMRWATAAFALLAGLFPALYGALKLDTHVDGIAHQAAQFKNLQDRFRQARVMGPQGTAEEYRSKFDKLMTQMEAARAQSITPPERCFAAARRKIKAGHYSFAADQPTS